MPAMTVKELERFLLAEFPQVFHSDSGLAIEAVWDSGCRVRQAFREISVRPGGTISGPTMMALADFAMYVAVLAAIGPVPLAVTINLNINFLRRPAPRDLVAEARGFSSSASASRWARSQSARTGRADLSPTRHRLIRSRPMGLMVL
jgi:acyl-coenzyme A thioesterase PaaI-like protein